MKSFKKALAVLLSALMVALSFPMSAFALYNPNNEGYAPGEEPYAPYYDVEIHAYLTQYVDEVAYGYTADIDEEQYVRFLDLSQPLKRSDLASPDGVFAIVFTQTGLPDAYCTSLTFNVDTTKITPANYGRRGTLYTGADGATLVETARDYGFSYDQGMCSGLDMYGNLMCVANWLDQEPVERTEQPFSEDVMGEPMYYEGTVLGVYGYQLLDGVDEVTIQDVLKLDTWGGNTYITPDDKIYDPYNLYLIGAVNPDTNEVNKENTEFIFPEWGYDAPSSEVTYTYTFADGEQTTVTAAAGEAPVAPANTEATAWTSNNDGTHSRTEYSWPEWVDGTTEYTEVETPASEACSMAEVPGTAVEPTHTEDGKAADQKCSVCGYTVTGATIPADADAHKWEEGETVASTCTTQGYTEYTCVCGETMRTPLPLDPDNHESLVEIPAVEATCVTEGFTAGQKCEECGVTTVEPTSTGLDAENHKNVVTDAAVEPTCTATGLTEGSHCADCQAVIVAQEEVPMIDHDYQVTESTGATCVVPGKVTYTCTMCGDTYDDEGAVDPNNHVNTEEIAGTAATCTAVGYTDGVFCNDCHTWVSGHEEIAVDPEAHTGTLEEVGNATEPTRGEDGYTGDQKWSCCGAEVKGKAIPALGVQVTVDGIADLGTVALNGDPVEDGVANKVGYKSAYTLTATPAEGAQFLGWSVNGKMISTDASYSTVAYADTVYVPVFAEAAEEFTVTFVDSFNMVLGSVSSADLASLEAMPEVYDYLGYNFTGWSMDLEAVKALDAAAVVTAQYEVDEAVEYTVSAPGATITVGGEEYTDTATVGFGDAVTVAADGATAWTVNGAQAAYGSEYTFFVSSDVDVTFSTEVVTAVPTVAGVAEELKDDGRVRFLATRTVPEGYTLVESGWVYGKDYGDADAALTLENATTGGCYIVKNQNAAADGQFALTTGLASRQGTLYARAYVVAADADGATAVYYADVQSYTYGA